MQIISLCEIALFLTLNKVNLILFSQSFANYTEFYLICFCKTSHPNFQNEFLELSLGFWINCFTD